MATSTPTNQLEDVIPVPTLSTQAFVYDSASKFDVLMAHVFAADGNQSYLFSGWVTSLAFLIERGGSKKDTIEESLRSGFYAYLNRYYQDVALEVIITEIDASSSRLDFQLNITISEGLNQYPYGVLIKTVRKQLQEIIRLNNYGS